MLTSKTTISAINLVQCPEPPVCGIESVASSISNHLFAEVVGVPYKHTQNIFQ
ncbi:hypothetical protein LOAG_15198, partial [Loa loa]